MVKICDLFTSVLIGEYYANTVKDLSYSQLLQGELGVTLPMTPLEFTAAIGN